MRFSRYTWLSAILGILMATNVMAQNTAKPSASKVRHSQILILNLVDVRRSSTAVKHIREQIAGFRKGFQADIEREEKALRSANQGLVKKRTILSPEAFAKERREFEQRVIKVQTLVQKRKQQLNKAKIEAMLRVEQHMNGIVSDIAKKRQASLVLRRSDIVLAARNLDITSIVLKRLNKELIKVPVKKPTD